MSGSSYSLSLDPLMRWMMWQRMLVSARYFAFADDLAAVLARMRESLRVLLVALDRRRAVSGLALKYSKGDFIPLWEDGVDELATYLRGDVKYARVATAARCLGVMVGVNTRER